MINRYRGYQEFLRFSEEVYAGTARSGALIELHCPLKENFKRESDWIYEGINLHNAMQSIGKLMESGKLPENTTIELFVANHEKSYFRDYIVKALYSGKCPTGVTLNFKIASFEGRKLRVNNKEFENYWILPLIRVMKSGQCPANFSMKFNCTFTGNLLKELQKANEIYNKFCEQQAVVPLVQAQRQGDFLPDTALNLICYFMCYPNSHQSPENPHVLECYKDTLTLISAACFVEQYGGFNSSALSKAFHAYIKDMLQSNRSKNEKANFIRTHTPLFVDAHENGKSRAVDLVMKFGLHKKPITHPSCKIKVDELDRISSAIERYNTL